MYPDEYDRLRWLIADYFTEHLAEFIPTPPQHQCPQPYRNAHRNTQKQGSTSSAPAVLQ